MTTQAARLCCDLDQFKQLTHVLCQQNPGENTRLIAHVKAADDTISSGKSLAFLRLIVVEQSGVVVAAAINNKKGVLGLSQMHDDSAQLICKLLLNESSFKEADFPKELAGSKTAVEAIISHGNFNHQIKFNLILHELIGTPIRGASNCITRIATAVDQPILIDWTQKFFLEINEAPTSLESTTSDVKSGIAHSNFLVALDEHQRPIAMAHAAQLPFSCARIGPVYTTPNYRGKGVAQASVAAASTHALQRGAKRVFLFTDQSNPASNIAYQRVGYQFIQEHLHVALINTN